MKYCRKQEQMSEDDIYIFLMIHMSAIWREEICFAFIIIYIYDDNYILDPN